MQDLALLDRFYLSDEFECGSLFDIWEEGRAWGDSVTPSTFSDRYRAWMLAKLEAQVGRSGATLLSLGCGNAVIESELRRRGCHVLAIDALMPAVALARRKGVDAVLADVATWDPPHRRWGVIYADGLLGHLYDPSVRSLPVLRRIRTWLDPGRGVLVVSNDVPPNGDETRPASSVPGFHWLATAYLARELRDAAFEVLSAEEFPYERPLSGTRRRAVLVARPVAAVMR